MSYSNGIQTSHTIVGMDFTGAAAEDLVLAGPKGLTGRVTSIVALVTTDVTVAASSINVGISGGDLDAYATAPVAIAAADAVTGNVVAAGASGNRIPADTKFAISNGGGSTAGVGNVTVTIEWS
jgi:hypothetical protein